MDFQNKISELRKRDIQNFQTNYFFSHSKKGVFCIKNDKAIVFLDNDRDIKRLYYAYTSLDDFSELISKLPKEEKICCEVIAKKEIDPDLYNVIDKILPFETVFERMRVKCSDLRQFKKFSQDEIEFARESDIQFIFNTLNQTFNHFSSHLPEIDELEQLCFKKHILTIRRDKNIVSILIFKLNGNTSNFDQLISLNHDTFDTMKIIDYYNSYLKNNNIQQSYLWVDIINNKGVKKMHNLFGYKPDGLKDYFFISKTLKETSLH